VEVCTWTSFFFDLACRIIALPALALSCRKFIKGRWTGRAKSSHIGPINMHAHRLSIIVEHLWNRAIRRPQQLVVFCFGVTVLLLGLIPCAA
jgi:hypothetical protein